MFKIIKSEEDEEKEVETQDDEDEDQIMKKSKKVKWISVFIRSSIVGIKWN